ncbi:MAG: sugar ABC transporter substrate-binding protein [Cyanobacteria bacterium P01_H01_bin.74]
MALFFQGCNLQVKNSWQISPPSKKTITLSTWGSAAELQTTQHLIKQFKAKNPTIQVKLLHIPENYFQKLHLLVAGNLTPDVMQINSLNFPVYASHSIFLDLTPLLKKDEHRADFYEDFYTQGLQAFQWQNTAESQKQPVIQGALPRDLSNLVVYVNKNLLKKANRPLPSADWNWDDFLATAKQLTQDTDSDGKPDQFGVSFYSKPALFWLPFVWSAGGDLFSTDRKQVLLDSPKSIEGLMFYSNLRNQWHVAPRREESGSQSMSELFIKGKLALLISGRWSVPVLRKKARFNWDVFPLPKGPSGLSRVGIDATGFAVARQSRHPEAALKLLTFLTSAAAIQEITRSGLIVPARKSIAESPVFLSKTDLPENNQAFISSIHSGLPTQSHPRWNEIAERLQLAMDPLWQGQCSASEAAKNATSQMTALLN